KDLQTVGNKLEAGETGLSPQDEFDAALFANQLCGRVLNFKANSYLKNRKNLKLMSRSVRLGMGAIRLALDEANLHAEHVNPDKFGVIVGAGLALGQSKDLVAGIRQSFDGNTFSSARFGEVGMRAINPLWLLKGLSNNVLGFATAELDARGFNQNYCNSGISGLQAIAEGAWALHERRAEIIVAGGSDSGIDPFHYAGFSRLRALSHAKTSKDVTSFGGTRDGFVLGEGAAYFVLAPENHPAASGSVLGRILGMSTMTCAEDPLGGESVVVKACIERSLQLAGITTRDIGAIIAHGNGSKRFDRIESEGIAATFGANCPPVTTNKPQLGHTLAASGPISLACALYAGQMGRVPPISNLESLAADCADIDVVTNNPRSISSPIIIIFAAGLGGQISSLLVEVNQ
ncbi:MAG: beta-ketoacyl-[acyl-carrier-protein] synthase family protein, partial [Bradymonadia bacterium]